MKKIELTLKQYEQLVKKFVEQNYVDNVQFTKHDITRQIRERVGDFFYVAHQGVKNAFSDLLKDEYRDKFTEYDNGNYLTYKRKVNSNNYSKTTCKNGNVVVSNALPNKGVKNEKPLGVCKLNKAGLNIPRSFIKQYNPSCVWVYNQIVKAKPDSRGDIRLSRQLLSRLGLDKSRDCATISLCQTEITKENIFIIR